MLVTVVVMPLMIVPVPFIAMIMPGVRICGRCDGGPMIVPRMVVTRSMRMAVSLAFNHPNHQGDSQPCEKGSRQNPSVVIVEMEFGQKIAHGNAQERPSRERKSVSQYVALTVGVPESQVKEQDACRDHQREHNVDHVTCERRPTSHRHKRPDRHRIKRLVQEDHQESPNTRQRRRRVPVRFSLDAGGQCDAGEDRVQCQPNCGPAPRQLV